MHRWHHQDQGRRLHITNLLPAPAAYAASDLTGQEQMELGREWVESKEAEPGNQMVWPVRQQLGR